MALWGWIAAAYGLVMSASALALLAGPPARRAAVSGVMYAAVAIAVAASPWPIMQLLAPAAILLGGYWLSGPFFRDPQTRLEGWLLDVDGRILARLRTNAWLQQASRVALEVLEAGYAAVYLVVPLGAVLLWPWGVPALERYWTVVLGAELACYLALPWIRTRPPRSLEAPGPLDRRPVVWRQVNRAVLDRASVQANTLPSGHVAGAVAAAGAVLAVWPAAGIVLMGTAALIAVSAVAGRYHYAVDVIAGAAVGAAAVLVV